MLDKFNQLRQYTHEAGSSDMLVKNDFRHALVGRGSQLVHAGGLDLLGQSPDVAEVLGHLPGDFPQQLGRQQLRVAPILVERHELHDVAGALGPIGSIQARVPVQLLHVAEGGVADAHDDDGRGQVGVVDDDILGGGHVVDFPVGEDEQDLVAVGVGQLLRCQEGLVQEWGEVGRACKLHIAHRIHIATHQVGKALDLRVLGVVVDGEAVDGLVAVDVREMRLGSEPEGGNLLVAVVVLDNVPDAFQDQLVLGRLLCNVVERVRARRDPVGPREVDGSHQVQLQPAFQVVNKVRGGNHLEIFKSNYPSLLYFWVQQLIFNWALLVLEVPGRNENLPDVLMVLVAVFEVPALHFE